MIDEFYDLLSKDKVIGCFKSNMPIGIIENSNGSVLTYESSRLFLPTNNLSEAVVMFTEQAQRNGYDLVGLHDVRLFRNEVEVVFASFNVNVIRRKIM